MPIYEYQCDDCGVRFDEMRKITDTTTPDCKECESTNVHRLVSLSSFHLKGTGWYVTDYARKEGRPGGTGSDNGKASAGTEATAAPSKKNEDKKKDNSTSAEPAKKGPEKPTSGTS